VPKHYTVSDGELVLFLWPAEEGGYDVTSPLDPALITQAETVEEAFIMARDAWELLKEARSEESRSASKRRTETRAAGRVARKPRISLK
jgi:predicted RNase H-like HicB family nuclease